MSPRTFTVCLVLAALAFAAWTWRDSELVRRFRPAALQSLFDRSALPNMPGATSGLRKCRSGSSVVYTDSPCPPGSREEAVGGSLTVLPAPPHAAQEPAKPQSLLRTLSGPEHDDLRRKQIDRVVDQ